MRDLNAAKHDLSSFKGSKLRSRSILIEDGINVTSISIESLSRLSSLIAVSFVSIFTQNQLSECLKFLCRLHSDHLVVFGQG